MPRLRRMSGAEVAAALQRVGFVLERQRGAHMKLARRGPDGRRQVMTVPGHDELATGTLCAVVRQASQFLPDDVLRGLFYTD